MSFVKNDNQQLTVLDSTFNLTEREKRMLEKSWANTFADKVFPAIDENIFSVLCSKKASRPNTPVNVIVGALILKEALNVELFYTCVANLCKIMDERGTKIPDEQYHYIKKDDYNKCIYHKRDMDATERNVVVMKDADILIKICDSTGDFDDTSEYQLLIRLLKERTIIDDGGSRRLRQKRGS